MYPIYQESRDRYLRSAIRALRQVEEDIEGLRDDLAHLVTSTDYRLTDLPGIDVVIAAELIAIIGDVTRFPTVDHFLKYARIAPVEFSSAGNKRVLQSEVGRRDLMALFRHIASTQLVVHKGTGTARNPEAREYFLRRLGEQAERPKGHQDRPIRKKALMALMRQQAIRFYKLMKGQKLAARERRLNESIGDPGVA